MNLNREQILINTLDVLTRQVDELKERVDHLAVENDELRAENVSLAKMVELLKKAPTLTTPAPGTGPIWPAPMPPIYPQTWYSNCPKCGLKLDQTMGYVCPNAGCPTGLGGAWCSTHTGTGQ